MRVVGASVLLLAVVSAVLEGASWGPTHPWLRWRTALFAVTALTQLVSLTRFGARLAPVVRALVPAAVLLDGFLLTSLPNAITPEMAVHAGLVMLGLLLTGAARAALWPAVAAAAGCGVAYAVTAGSAEMIAPDSAAYALAVAVLTARTPILLLLGAALTARTADGAEQGGVAGEARRQGALASLSQLALEGALAPALMERAVALAADALAVDTAAIFAIDAEGKGLDLRAGVAWPVEAGGARLNNAAKTLARCVLDSDAPVVMPDLAADARFTLPPLLVKRGFVSGAAVRIAGEPSPFGMLIVLSTRRWTCDAAASDCLAALARILATAFVRQDANRRLGGEAEIASALVKVGRELLSSMDTPVLLERACEINAQAIGADHSQTWLLDVDEQTYVPVASYGLDDETWGAIRALRVRAETMTPLIHRLEQEGAVDVAPGTHRHPFLETVLVQFGIGRALVAPLLRGEEPIGVQVIGRAASTAFSPEQAQLAGGIARLAAIALRNARLVEDAEHASQLKSEFLSTMSHELRTPLNVIIGYLDMLADDPTSPPQPDILGRVRSSSLELLDMIEGTLNLNRIEAGQDIPHLAELSVDELIEELRGEFAVHPRKTEAALRWQPLHGVQLYSDRRRLKIILKNLVGNALKFTPTGEVFIGCDASDRACVFTVRDTGIGIPTTHLDAVFDMFRQVDSSESRSYSGAGLGLYIVKRLLDQLGGTIELSSEVGRGSTFRVRLPNEPVAYAPSVGAPAVEASTNGAADETAAAARHIGGVQGNVQRTAEVARGALPQPARKQRILYADDLELNRHLLRRFIARHLPDVEFFEASDGAHALAVFEAHQPDLVLLDLRMPKMDGWMAARRLRALEGGRDVPILAVTVTASPGAEAYALHAGCNEFLTKPISDYGVLLSRIEYWLGRSASRPSAAPVRHEPSANVPPRERPPRPEPTGSDMVCVLCNQPLPTLSNTAHEKRRHLAASPVPR